MGNMPESSTPATRLLALMEKGDILKMNSDPL
jgi:hypothetical protein